MLFKEFNYSCLEEIKKEAEDLNLTLHFSNDLDILSQKVVLGEKIIPNSLAFHPMEGCDGEEDGSPGELTIRKYERFAAGGAGLIWFEAVAVVHEGRAYPAQLWINQENADKYCKLMDQIEKNASKELGTGFKPVCIMQLTHSGRFSKPNGKAEPLIACHNPYLDPIQRIDNSCLVLTDDHLEELEEKFEEAAVLAKKAGFDGVDVKSCHRYLNSELLSAYTREGKYGGTFEGRTRFITNITDRIKSRLGSKFIVTTRMNIYDGIPYPYGWGVDRTDPSKYDLSEPVKLVGILKDKGVNIINFTMGTPYYNPHVNRPYDKGGYVPQEHPLQGVARLYNGIGEMQKQFPDMAVVGTGFSWLRNFSPYLAAGGKQNGYFTIAGYGRESFAYPDFAKDILNNGGMKKEKSCIACGKCTEIMRAGGTAGCVIRDSRVYSPIYNQYCSKKVI